LYSLEEEGVITECLIKVLDDTDTIDFDFQTENVVSKVVFKASGFKESLSEIDLKADCKYFIYFSFHFFYFYVLKVSNY
jgi:hypothetical protein